MNDIAKALVASSKTKALFDALPPSHQKEYIVWIDQAKKPETRARRIQKMLEMLQAKANT